MDISWGTCGVEEGGEEESSWDLVMGTSIGVVFGWCEAGRERGWLCLGTVRSISTYGLGSLEEVRVCILPSFPYGLGSRSMQNTEGVYLFIWAVRRGRLRWPYFSGLVSRPSSYSSSFLMINFSSVFPLMFSGER